MNRENDDNIKCTFVLLKKLHENVILIYGLYCKILNNEKSVNINGKSSNKIFRTSEKNAVFFCGSVDCTEKKKRLEPTRKNA